MTKQHKQLALVFPGQGSQQVGMLKAMAEKFPLVEEIFQQASQILAMDLWAIVQQGPESALNNTVNTQPALLASSYALWCIWQSQEGLSPKMMAGHSLGEYSALVCAKAMCFEDGIELVALRGKLMQEAVPQGEGAMAAVLGLDDKKLQIACQEASQGEVVAMVNYNAIGQTVIAGNIAAVERASALAKSMGAKRVLPLPVSVPSHCELMREAAKKLAKRLEQIKISSPNIPVIHNVDVDICQHPDDIRDRLVQQLYCPVRWVETVQRLSMEGIQQAIECGPGKVLTGLIKRIEPSIAACGIETPQEMGSALALIK